MARRYAEAFGPGRTSPGVFQTLHVTHEDVERIIRDPRVGFVAFTGSVDGGHAVQRRERESVLSVPALVSGSAYIRADAFLDQTIENLVTASSSTVGNPAAQ